MSEQQRRESLAELMRQWTYEWIILQLMEVRRFGVRLDGTPPERPNPTSTTPEE